MLGKMRVISSLLLSVVMLLLLMLRVLPHHHTLYLSGSDAVVETLHFGVEECEDGCDASHDEHDKCPIEDTCCVAKGCEEIDYYKYTINYDFSPAILSLCVEVCMPSADAIHSPPYINLKIPDGRAETLSLRAPPHTVC